MGIDCAHHSGIHVWEDHYLVEVIAPDTHKPLPDGREGELVITTLKREALPVIRYRTRDICAVISRERCACGRTHLRVSRFKGRTDDMLIVKGVNFYPSQIERILLAEPGVAHDYQITLERDSAGVEKISVVAEVYQPLGEEIKGRLAQRMHNEVGLRIPLNFVPAGSIPRPPGKAVRVVDCRD